MNNFLFIIKWITKLLVLNRFFDLLWRLSFLISSKIRLSYIEYFTACLNNISEAMMLLKQESHITLKQEIKKINCLSTAYN